MKEKYNKFIVINRKKFEQLYRLPGGENAIDDFQEALNKFDKALNFFGIDNTQKYLVCNEDEPYAEEVLQLILKEEKI